MKKLNLVLILIGILTNTYSQSTLLWSKDFATGLNNYYSNYPGIRATGDTIEVIGRKNSANGQRLLIVKYDLLGDTISTKTFGHDSVNNNTIVDFKFDESDHVYILNNEKLGFFKSKIVLQKYSMDGSLIWVAQIQDPADTSYRARSLGLASDTCIFITAYKEYNYPAPGDDVIYTKTLSQLYTYNSNGNQLWHREFDPISEISWFAYDIFTHNNIAYLFANSTASTIKLVKVDINNNISINTNTGILNGINNVQLTHDNHLLITAMSKYRISKAYMNGTVVWTYDYGTFLPGNVFGDEIIATIQDSAGNIYVTGRHYGHNYGTPQYTNADILTIKYNSNGNLVWQNRYEYGSNNADIGYTIVLKNGMVYVGGYSQRLGQATDCDYIVLKIDAASGVSTGVYRYDGLASGDEAVSSICVFDNGNVALTGLSYINGQYDWTTQLLSDVVLSIQSIGSQDNVQIYPNPAISGQVLNITGEGIKSYSIISSIGKIVQQGQAGTQDIHSIRLENLSSGIYLINLQTDKETMARKIIVK